MKQEQEIQQTQEQADQTDMKMPAGTMGESGNMETAAEPAQPEEEEKKPSMLRELLSWVEVMVAAVIISFFLTRVVLVNSVVPSSSMETLISPGDRLFGNRLAYKFSDPERFDVVIFKYPVDEEENYIKKKNESEYIIEGRTPLEELSERFGISFEENDFETLNGFLISRMDRIPTENEKFETDVGDYHFKVLSVKNKMIHNVLVTKNEQKPEPSDEAET